MPADLDAPSAIDPDEIAAQSFTKARKGYEADEVRAFLVSLASRLREANRLAGDQDRRLAELERRNADPHDLDEAAITELVGEETTRVLETARQSAKDMRSKADAAAAETTRTADVDAAKTRAEAETYASELRQAADDDTARIRSEADAYSQAERSSADDETKQQRDDADAYAAEVRATADAEVAELQSSSATEVAELRAAANAVLAERTADAEVEASAIRSAAEDYSAQVRADADRYGAETTSAADTYEADHRGDADAVLSQATADAERLRSDVEAEVAAERTHAAAAAAARHQQAESEADALIADARERGRTMVQEARTYRERVIADLADRRRDARNDLEDLAATRDALAVTLTDVVDGIESSHSRLQALAIDPRDVGDGAVDRAALPDIGSRPPVAVGEIDGEGADPEVDESADVDPEDADGSDDDDSSPTADLSDVESETGTETESETDEEAEAELEAEGATEATAGPDVVVDDDPSPVEDPDGGSDLADDEAAADDGAIADEDAEALDEDPDAAGTDADDIFARLRADQETTTEPTSDDDAAGPDSAEVTSPEPGEEPFASEPVDLDPSEDESESPRRNGMASDDADLLDLRDATTDDVERQLARRLKRVLSDEQNESLDLLRRSKGSPNADEVLPDEATHLGRYAAAAQEDLVAAERAGAGFFGDAPGRAADVSDVAAEFASDLVRQIRGRLTRAFDDGGDEQEVGERIRSVYREWKTHRIADAARHYVLVAFSRGVADAADSGEPFRWLVDDGDAPCPDCDDNALAGLTPIGEPFPTGDLRPPAHPGCRCLAVPASSA